MDPDMQQNTRSIGMYSQYVYTSAQDQPRPGEECGYFKCALPQYIYTRATDGCIAVRFIKKII